MHSSDSPKKTVPPLAISAVMLLLLLAALPSALQLPLPSSTETPEYAPIPPEGDSPPSNEANFAALGSASGAGLGSQPGEGLGSPPGGVAGPAGRGKNPSTKKCVGSPPRQTEDPLSPPCVAHFEGDNFGATHRGVTADEVRVLVYLDGGGRIATSRGYEQIPEREYFDLSKPGSAEDNIWLRWLRGWQSYFNTRYQTYGRAVTFTVYFGGPRAQATPETRRAEAADNDARVQPYAVINFGTAHVDSYTFEMARRGATVFGSFLRDSFAGQPESFFARYPKLLWSYLPSIEHRARLAVDYACTKVVGQPVEFSGVAEHAGGPRRFGFLTTTDPLTPSVHRFAKLVRAGVEACGGQIVASATFPESSLSINRGDPQGAAANMAMFRERGVTTVLWAGGKELHHSRAAAALGYRPEWVVMATGDMERGDAGQAQDQDVWRHARVVTTVTYMGAIGDQLCFQSQREADPEATVFDAAWACFMYDDLRQFFTAVQVAGPRLTPSSVDTGFHAIPPASSPDPRVPACYYESGDYTCVKDAVAQWWDPERHSPNSFAGLPGCWAVPQQGKRFRAGHWPSGNVDSHRRPNDPCNSFGSA